MEHSVCCRFIVLITTLQVQTEKFYHSAAKTFTRTSVWKVVWHLHVCELLMPMITFNICETNKGNVILSENLKLVFYLFLLNLVKHVIKLFREAPHELMITILVNWFKQHNVKPDTYICALSSSLSEGSGKRQKKKMHFCLFWIFF